MSLKHGEISYGRLINYSSTVDIAIDLVGVYCPDRNKYIKESVNTDHFNSVALHILNTIKNLPAGHSK